MIAIVIAIMMRMIQLSVNLGPQSMLTSYAKSGRLTGRLTVRLQLGQNVFKVAATDLIASCTVL